MQRVAEASEWFIRTPSMRLLDIVTSDVLRLAALEHLTATELLDVNTCPFFVLEAPTELDDDGWTLRSEELRADWSGLVDAAAACDIALGPLWPEPVASTPLERFCLELHSALHARAASMSGLVIVLAPVWIRDGDRWRTDLSKLLSLAQLGEARFVIVECGEPESLVVAEQLGLQAEFVDARAPTEALRGEMRTRVEAMASAPPGATGPTLTGAAGPNIAPPMREGAPVPSPDVLLMQAEQLGISPVLLDTRAMYELRVAVLGASLAMADKEVAQALTAQTRARDFCIEHELHREAVVSELVLGGYELQAGHPEQAIATFEAAGARAIAAGLGELAVLAQFSVGSSHLVGNEIEQAILAYDEAGHRGAAVGSTVLTSEAWRMRDELLRAAGVRGSESV